MAKPGWTYWYQVLTTPGVAWVNLTLALALHVLDESAHDFLSYYNPAARAIGERLSAGVPPTFTSDVWLSGLIVGLILLLALSPFAFRCARPMRPVALALAVLMILNACIHITWSLARGEVVAGTYSSPVLLAAAIFLLVAAVRNWKPSPSRQSEEADDARHSGT